MCVHYSVPDENCKFTFNILELAAFSSVTVCFMWQLKPDKQAQIRKVYEIHVAGIGNNLTTLTVFSSELRHHYHIILVIEPHVQSSKQSIFSLLIYRYTGNVHPIVVVNSDS